MSISFEQLIYSVYSEENLQAGLTPQFFVL